MQQFLQAIAATALCAATVEAVAQPADSALEEIIVTGSRIPRTGFETLQPAIVIDGEELEMRGSVSLADTLNELPGFSRSADTPRGNQGRFSAGENLLNFLGLGVQRTLTLVNGQRFPAANALDGLAVDINAIPDNLVERVETIAVGGAPIYGSDAIAGTVNIILKDDYEGFDIIASTGMYPDVSDGQERRLGITWGRNFAGGRGNITVSAQHASAEAMKATDRPLTSTQSQSVEAPADPESPYDYVLYDEPLIIAVAGKHAYPLFFGNQFGFNIFGNGIPLDILDPASPLSQFDADGNLVPFVPGEPTGSVIWRQGGDGLNLTDYNTLQAELDRSNLTLLSNYELDGGLNLKTEIWWSQTEAAAPIRQPPFNDPSFGGLPQNGWGNVGGGPIPVLLDNPFLNEATRSSIGTALNIRQDFNGDGLADPTIDTNGDSIPDAVGFWVGNTLKSVVGDNGNWSDKEFLRVVLGVDGQVELGQREFEWDVNYAWGGTDTKDREIAINQVNFEKAVQVLNDGSGNAICADPSGGCVPLNAVGVPSPEAIDYVTDPIVNRAEVRQQVFSANLSGDVVDLPAGPMGLAAGFTWRKEEADAVPDQLILNDASRFDLNPMRGEFDSTELYAETVVPLLGGRLDTPLVESLEFEGAFRLVDNSIAGSDTTWTAGLRYRPVAVIEIRGNVTEAIRAPALLEMFLAPTMVASFAQDPCDARFIGAGNVPEVRAANCAAEGIAQPFTSFVVNSSQLGTLSGNTDLDNERAESKAFGLVFRPASLEGFTASLDWFDIEIREAIENLSLSRLMEACYESADFPNETACSRFQRGPDFQITDFNVGYINLGQVEFRGLQTALSWLTSLGRFGDISFNLRHMYTARHIVASGTGNENDWTGTIGQSQHRVNLSATWNWGKWSVYNQVRWLQAANFINDPNSLGSFVGPGDWTVVNSTVGRSLNDNIDLRLTIDNLFDREAPYPHLTGLASLGTYYQGYVGRFATLSLQARFE